MSTRFQTQGPRIGYEVVQQQKPGQQLMGLYNTWQSLAPSTRDWITSGFGLFENTDEYGFPVDREGNRKDYEAADKEELLDKISDREDAPERDDYSLQSWEGISPIEIEVGAMDPYGIDNIQTEELPYESQDPRERTKKLLTGIRGGTPRGWGSF